MIKAQDRIFKGVNEQTKEFLEFVLSVYRKDGYITLADDNLSKFLTLKYGSPLEAEKILGSLYGVKSSFYSLQNSLYA